MPPGWRVRCSGWWGHDRPGIGALGTAYRYPSPLDAVYGSGPAGGLLFARIRL